MKIVFMGTPDFSVPILRQLHKNYDVVLVVTQPDTPQGRKRVLTPPPVKVYAEKHHIPCFQPKRIKEDHHPVIEAKPDIIITAAYGQIIPETLLDFSKYKAINVHASLLPKLRGGAPIQRAIERRHKTTGVTIMEMVKKMDAGDILAQEAIPIDTLETSGTLFDKLSNLGAVLLLQTLPDIIHQRITPIPQNPKDVTFAYNITREEERLDFNESVLDLEAKIRAFHPQPNTYTVINNKKLKIIWGRVHQCKNFFKNHTDTENGTIIKHFQDGFAVKCPDGALIATQVQLEGKNPMSAEQFLRGAGQTLAKVGTKLA